MQIIQHFSYLLVVVILFSCSTRQNNSSSAVSLEAKVKDWESEKLEDLVHLDTLQCSSLNSSEHTLLNYVIGMKLFSADRYVESYGILSSLEDEFISNNEIESYKPNFYHFLGLTQSSLENYFSAIIYQEKYSYWAEKLGMETAYTNSLIALANNYVHLNKRELALEYFQKAIQFMDDESISKDISFWWYFNLGYFELEEGNYEKGKDYFNQALELEARGDTSWITIYALTGMADLYTRSDLDSAFFYYEKLYKISNPKARVQHIYATLGMAKSLYPIDQSKSILLYKQALEKAEAFVIHRNIVEICDSLASIYKRRSNIKLAEHYLYKGYQYMRQIEARKDEEGLIINMAKLEKQQKQEIDILAMQQLAKETQLRSANNIKNLLIIIVFLLIVLAFVVRNNRIREKNNEQQFKSMRDNLFANISHEFRTPLSILKTTLNEMRHHTQKGAFFSYVTLMHRNVENLVNLSNQMLDLAKMSESQIQINNTEVEIAAYVKHLLSLVSPMVAYNELELILIAPLKKIKLKVDKNILQKIIINLVYNAIKFTPKGGRVEVQLTYQASDWVIKVSDTGIGIDPRYMSNIFERYYRPALENSQVETGGLGLALTKELVELCRGDIQVQSELKRGTTFLVTLPHQYNSLLLEEYQTVENHRITPQSILEQSALDTQLLSTKKIISQNDVMLPLLLIVEDNEDLNLLLYNYLSEDYRVERAYNGKEALQKIEATIPDLILSDVMMPEMNGIELTEKLLTDINYSHIPIIMLSALESNIQNLKLWRQGIVDFINKPFDMDILKYKIRNQLNSREQFKAKIFKNDWSSIFTKTRAHSIDKVFLQSLIQSIEDHIGKEHFAVEELSKVLMMSRSGLYHKVKALTGYSPTVFIKKYRLNKAKELLSRRSGNISEIAMEVGYYNASQFSRIFKEEFGVPPSSFR